jgi:cytochrome P450
MIELTRTRKIAITSQVYLGKARTAYTGYVKRNPLALLALHPGHINPYPQYERLRARGTLNPTELGDWLTTSYRVSDAVLRDRRFGMASVNPSFLGMNPPDHTRLRRLAAPAFSPKAVNTYAGRIERVASQLLDEAARKGEFDLISAVAAPLPIAVITALLGIPDSDAERFVRYGVVLGESALGIRSLRQAAELHEVLTELEQLFHRLFALRRAEPGDDVVSQIVAAEGDQIKPGEMMEICKLLLIAGYENTVNLIGSGVMALLSHPEQWKTLCADPEGVSPKVVEETLRYDPPVHLASRQVLEPMELEGQQVRAGQKIVPLLAAANRDPEVYENPATFDLDRDNPPPHLAFASGIHYCLGAPLATLEGRIAFRLIAERMPGLRQVGPVKLRNSLVIRGPRSLPVAC